MRTIALIGLAAGAALALPTAALAEGSGGVTGPAFYANGEVYRTVGTPTDLSRTRAPAHSFDRLYLVPGQMPVAEAAPGERDFNGGRWMVTAVSGDTAAAVADTDVDLNGNGVIDSDDELGLAVDAGYLEIGGVVRLFVCPVIRL